MLHAEACHQQACFIVFAQPVDVLDTTPELIVTDVQLFDQLYRFLQKAQDDEFCARVALLVLVTCGVAQERLDLR